MALNTDNETLTKELKMAAKMGRNFILSLTARPADGFLALSKKVIPKSEDVTARKKTQKKVFRGTCFKDGTTLVFETDKKVSPALTLKLKLLIKEQTAFKLKDIELREKSTPGAAEAEPAGTDDEGEEEVQAAAGAGAAVEEEEQAQTATGPGDQEGGATATEAGDVNPFSGEASTASTQEAVDPKQAAKDKKDAQKKRAAFKKARQTWVKARTKAEEDLEVVKNAFQTEYAEDPQLKDVNKRIRELDEIMDNLSDDLREVLDAYAATPLGNKSALEEQAERARKVLNEFTNYVGKSKLLAAVDAESGVGDAAKVKVKAPLSKALKSLAKTIG